MQDLQFYGIERRNNIMSRETYNYKRTAITTARDLCYSDEVVMQIRNAKTENEISRIMRDARLKGV